MRGSSNGSGSNDTPLKVAEHWRGVCICVCVLGRVGRWVREQSGGGVGGEGVRRSNKLKVKDKNSRRDI